MTIEYELKSLEELDKMAGMTKKEISEHYKIPIDGADDYFRIKTKAILDVVIDGLRYVLKKDEEDKAEEEKHYKGVAEGDIPKRYF